MATQNSINKKTQDLTIDPGAAGDSFVQFDINAGNEFRIGVDDTDDSFRISQGTALGTNDTFVMTDAGERTMPLQPAFLAYLASTDSNVTGDGAVYYVGTNTAFTEVFDIGGNFNTDGTFTAPITAKYYLHYWFCMDDVVNASVMNMQIVTTARSYVSAQLSPSPIKDTGGQLGLNMTVLADMTAADTATYLIYADGEAGNTIDLVGGASLYTGVAGFLAC